MNLKVETIMKDSPDLVKINHLYNSSFPEKERIPMWLLLRKSNKDFIDFIAFYDNDIFVGFAYLISNQDMTYVLYLAINLEVRSKGYGSMALSKIKVLYPTNRIILNIEAVDVTASNYEQRLKRKQFYSYNGYKSTTYMIAEYGDSYEVLINGNDIKVEELSSMYRKFMGTVVYLFYKPKFLPVSI
ncbi:N-acetyltransferase [Paenibacillus sp. PK3_47]|uniref:GNAT family N-acetyltransferase n=1 Tax=Paenibacillus sp. PK3_47 TaxID=2072642 RepID=UPI00201E32E2|nr:GNAT family N-acetyltransferase [Paenibacillus sp. PK3_47]UQZ36114.1 N-acetyltransferase [Paenibacillus sp. PK3_47]